MFAHLHVHSEYSLLDGACRIEDLAKRAKELGQTAIALTDHGVMYGVVDFYKACKKEGIKPIIGCEVYVAARDRFDKSHVDNESSHLVLLCKNEEGYKNLINMVSEGFVNGFYYKPRVDMNLLRENKGGIIALSACLAGSIPRALLNGDTEKAKKLVEEFKDIFDEFYIEIQDHKLDEQKRLNPLLVSLAKETNTPLVATNDVHYIKKEDAHNQDVLMCIQMGKTLDEENRMKFETEEFYLKSEEEMLALFPYAKEAIENTEKIAQKCEFEFKFGERHLPSFSVPDNRDPFEFLKSLCEEGLIRVYKNPTQEMRERLDYELSVIKKMGFVDYFLIVWDFIRFARENGIMVGPGRGSAAGSIVSYTLGITSIDPLKYNLLFERFLNPERVSMPDIDIDFCYERRGEVINYVIEKYGADHVAQIGTFGTMKARGAIRDTGRVLGMPYSDVDAVAKMIPQQMGITIEDSLEIPKVKEIYENNESVKLLIDTARAIEGLPRNVGTHAAGVVIAKEAVSKYVPLQRSDDIISTQFTMTTIEELGLLKMDFLGLRNLTIIRDCIDNAKENGKYISLEDIDYNCEKVYQMLSKGETSGVFQLESGGMRSFMKKLMPSTLEDIIAGISLYRPGPMDFIPTYIKNKENPSLITYKHPSLAPILDMTYGCIVYQEQVMQIVRALAGFSMGRADEVRRAMSKKKQKEMEKARHDFIYGQTDEEGNIIYPGCVKNGIDEKVASSIFDDMDAFAKYAFNKSHAAAYAVIAYQTAYLKCLYPIEYMAALLSAVMGDNVKVAEYIEECKKMGIKVLPPDINKSKGNFTVEGEAIRFGLSTVKNVGANFINECVKERERSGAFKSMRDFAERMSMKDLNKRAVEGLIKCGAFDFISGTRAQLLLYYEKAIEAASKSSKTNIEGQMSFFAGEDDMADELPNAPEMSKKEILAMEKEAAGIYVSGHPLDEYREALSISADTNIADVISAEQDISSHIMDGVSISVAGIITGRRDKLTKSNTMMSFLTVEDLTGSIEVIVFPKTLMSYGNIIQENEIVTINGRVDMKEDENTKIILESIELFNNSVKGETLVININENQLSLLDRAHNIIKIHSGRVRVVLNIGDKSITADKSIGVNINDTLLKELKDLFGESSICVEQSI